MRRRHLVLVGIAATCARRAVAQGNSDKPPIRVLVGFPPGGSADTIARQVAEAMRPALGGQIVLVENKPGAGGRVAIDQLKNAAPDGQTLIVMPSGPVVLFPHVFRKLNYDAVRDLTPICRLAEFQFAVVSGPGSNVKNMAEMIARAKADPAATQYGSPGQGTVPHFLGLMIGDVAGIQMLHVPFQGGAPAMNALLGGHVGYNVDVVSESLEQHRAGKVRIIAVSGATRSPQVPEVPTLREQGVPMDATAWFAMYGPGGMKAETVERLNKAVVRALGEKSVRERLASTGLEVIASTPEQLAAVQRADLLKWEKPVKTSGFKAD